jgi:hypothetical protein
MNPVNRYVGVSMRRVAFELGFYSHLLKYNRVFQNAACQGNLSPEAPEPTHVHCLEVIMAVHMTAIPCQLTIPTVVNKPHVVHLLYIPQISW